MNWIKDDSGDGRFLKDSKERFTVQELERENGGRDYSAWKGSVEQRDTAAKTPPAESIEKAVEYLRYRKFKCARCGITRGRVARTLWDDECTSGGRHDWIPFTRGKKQQDGRKINIWFSDAQLDEVERVAEETGNDRASTIRELVALGLKLRGRLDSVEFT